MQQVQLQVYKLQANDHAKCHSLLEGKTDIYNKKITRSNKPNT